MAATLKRLFGSWPTWTLITGGGALAALLVLVFLYYVWLGVALILFAVLALSAAWAWVELPERYTEGADAAELAAQERWRRMMRGD